MRTVPYPVRIERIEDESDVELDQLRRGLMAQILIDMGVTDANKRTMLSQPMFVKSM